jgi:hypothetical protein
MAVLAGACVVGGLVALVGAVIGHGEQVAAMWVRADVADDGSAQISEVIDYDFGSSFDKHGIYRVVPGLSPEAPIAVEADAPDDVDVSIVPGGTRIRIGDPVRTVSGSHRYQIGYPLPGVVIGDRLAWDAVGTQWEVGIARAEIHLMTPFELVDARCFEGTAGSDDPCVVREVEPGHLVVTVDDLAAGEGVSIEAQPGSALADPPAGPEPPTERPDHPGTGLVPPALAGAAATLAAGLVALWLVRRAGRERVGAGGAADAAWADGGGPLGEVRMDHEKLAEMATVEFAPPGDLTAAQGGIVLAEGVKPNHKVAWLIGAAIEGSVELAEEDGTPGTRLVRKASGSPETAMVLETAFDGRDELVLGSYDRDFAKAWQQLDNQLGWWQAHSGLWDPRAEARRLAARVLGIVAIVLGALVLLAGGAAANRWGGEWLPLAVVGGLIAGPGVAATTAAWELHVRTVAGSSAWLRVESFRKFLAESEAYHAEEAAKRGVLREYTAWAVAVGEIDRWSRAVAASSAIPAAAGIGYVHAAPLLYGATAASATAPSSRGSGGFGGGGGSVGGGAGGGGGGSW